MAGVAGMAGMWGAADARLMTVDVADRARAVGARVAGGPHQHAGAQQ